MTERVLIVNADDFGASDGINGGIVEAHVRGIVTSTSLMVTGEAAAGAALLAREHRELAIGLHWDLDGEAGVRRVEFEDAAAVRAELARQVDAFVELIGRPPSHVDSHHHVHRDVASIAPLARELAADLGVHLRDSGRVTFVGGFYGQWTWGVTDLHHVSPEFLIGILRNEVGPGWTELGCHPGRDDGTFASEYLPEREAELVTLTDPRVRDEIAELGIRLASYAELPAAEQR
jgi:chitin disaccharide deacetylase